MNKIERIKRMEQYLDRASQAVMKLSAAQGESMNRWGGSSEQTLMV